MLAKITKLKEAVKRFQVAGESSQDDKTEISQAYARMQKVLREEIEKEKKTVEDDLGVNIIGID